MESYTCLLYEEIGRRRPSDAQPARKIERFKRRFAHRTAPGCQAGRGLTRASMPWSSVVLAVRSVPATTSPRRQSGRATQATRTIRSDISRMEETVGRWQMLWNLRIPTIAQVHGYCVAGGRIWRSIAI